MSQTPCNCRGIQLQYSLAEIPSVPVAFRTFKLHRVCQNISSTILLNTKFKPALCSAVAIYDTQSLVGPHNHFCKIMIALPLDFLVYTLQLLVGIMVLTIAHDLHNDPKHQSILTKHCTSVFNTFN